MAARSDREEWAALSLVLAWVCAAWGIVVMVGGWLLNLDILLGLAPGFRMVPSTALCFILLGFGLGLAWSCEPSRAKLAYRIGYVVVAIAVANLATFIVRDPAGLDRVLMPWIGPLDMMSPATSIGMLMASYCLFAVMAPDNPDPDGMLYFSVLGASTGFGVVAASLLDPLALVDFNFFRSMSVYTAILFVVYFVAILAYPAERLGRVVYRRRI
ncbi:hypothetical protein GLS40_01905 [Pseudooceanicola sp. 216_PA32_1]|uniref:Uncharacterized protein n=1 Tax=Pseudooceanicola pacificus TaxID=2676438 RepID=A0A844W7R7_9RHOB|nr:hypothetical protein [Pseudooceanicola pacificus]MWB76773.1 hypothetical protein [Pseudooceanicola pacificus]